MSSLLVLVRTQAARESGHRTPRLRGVYAASAAHAKSPSSIGRPTERRCESSLFRRVGGMEIGTMRLSDASRGGPHSLNHIRDIVEPCGQGHSGRHPTHKRVFHADRLTERQETMRKSRHGKRCTHVDTRQPEGGGAGSFPLQEQT